MLLLCLWWSALVCAYSAGLAWLHYDGVLLRAQDARYGREESAVGRENDARKDAPLARGRRVAALVGTLTFVLSCALLTAHFLTPRTQLRAGPFNTTL